MPRTEVLSMRISPMTRFQIEFIGRARGQNISTVVERAIMAAASNEELVQMNAPTTDTTKLLRQLYRALHIAIDDGRKVGVTPDSAVEKALAAYEAWAMTVPDDEDC